MRLLSTALIAAAALAQSTVAPSTAKDPAKLSARDSHEGLLVAADPWMRPEDYKTRFGKKNPYESGIIAIDAYFKNEEDLPVQVELFSITLTVAIPGQEQQDLPSLSAHDVTAAVFNAGPLDPTQRRRRLPIPTGRSNSTKDFLELQEKLRSATLASDLVPPHGIVHGLFYFDLDGNFDWLGSSKFYVPNLKRMPTGKPLLFFEVPLSTAAR